MATVFSFATQKAAAAGSGPAPGPGQPNPDDTDGDGLSNQYEIAHGLDPRSADSDGDGLTDDTDAVPYESGFDKWERQAVPGYAVIETGAFTPTAVNEHLQALGHLDLGGLTGEGELKEYYLWEGGSWSDHPIGTGGRSPQEQGDVHSLILTPDADQPVAGSLVDEPYVYQDPHTGEDVEIPNSTAFVHSPGGGMAELNKPAPGGTGTVVARSYAPTHASEDGSVIYGTAAIVYRKDVGYRNCWGDTGTSIQFRTVIGEVAWPGGWLETIDEGRPFSTRMQIEDALDCGGSDYCPTIAEAKDFIRTTIGAYEEEAREISAEPVITGEEPLTFTEERDAEVRCARASLEQSALQGDPGNEVCSFETPKLCSWITDRTATFGNRTRDMVFGGRGSGYHLLTGAGLVEGVPTEGKPDFARVGVAGRWEEEAPEPSGSGECGCSPGSPGEASEEYSGVWVTHEGKDEIIKLHADGRAKREGAAPLSELSFPWEGQLRALATDSAGREGQWVNGEFHSWASMTGGYDVDFADNGGEAVVGQIVPAEPGPEWPVDPETGEPVEVGGILVPYEFVTTNPDRGGIDLSDGSFTYSDPTPVVEMEITDASLSPGGDLTVTVEGKMKDRLSEVFKTAADRVQSLHFSINGISDGDTRAFEYTGQGAPPFYHADSETSFTKTFTVAGAKPGTYVFRAETDENYAENTGWDQVAVSLVLTHEFQPAQTTGTALSIAFENPPSTSSANTARVYFGDRPPASGDGLVAETGPDTAVFEGELEVDGVMADCTMTLFAPSAMDPQAGDWMGGRIEWTLPDGTRGSFSTTWIETDANSLQFSPDPNGIQLGPKQLVIGKTADLEGSQTRSFEPMALRFPLGAQWADADSFTVEAGGQPHKLKKIDYEDEEAWYAVGSPQDGDAKVYVPSAKPMPQDHALPGLVDDTVDAEVEWTMQNGSGSADALIAKLQHAASRPETEDDDEGETGDVTWDPEDIWEPGQNITREHLFAAYRFLYTDDFSRILLEAFEEELAAGDAVLELGNIVNDYKFVPLGWGGTYKIKIEHNDDVHPGIAAQYLWRGLNEALVKVHSYRVRVDSIAGIETSIQFHQAWRDGVGPAVAETGIAGAELYLASIGIVNEAFDWVLVVNDLSEGHYSSLAAALPFVSRGLIRSGKRLVIRNYAQANQWHWPFQPTRKFEISPAARRSNTLFRSSSGEVRPAAPGLTLCRWISPRRPSTLFNRAKPAYSD